MLGCLSLLNWEPYVWVFCTASSQAVSTSRAMFFLSFSNQNQNRTPSIGQCIVPFLKWKSYWCSPYLCEGAPHPEFFVKTSAAWNASPNLFLSFLRVRKPALALKDYSIKSPLKQKWSPSSPSLQNQAGISFSYISFFIHGKNRLLSKYQHGVECNVQVNSKLIFLLLMVFYINSKMKICFDHSKYLW